MLLNSLGPTSPIDTINSVGIVIQVTGGSSGFVLVEVSADASDNSWKSVPVREAGAASIDHIANDGLYTLAASARYLRLNALDINTPFTIIIQGRTSSADCGQNVLDQAADSSTGVTLGVRTELAKDLTNALLISDAPPPTYGIGVATGGIMIAAFDTKNYPSTTLQLFGTWAGTVSWYSSNDAAGSGWTLVSAWSAAGGSVPVSSATANGMWSLPSAGRFLRVIFTTATSGAAQVSLLQRSAPPIYADNNTATFPVNVSQIAGTGTVTAGISGLQAVGGNVAPGVAATSNPLPLGAVDTLNRTRRLQSDASGNLIVTGPPQMGLPGLGFAPVLTYEVPDMQGNRSQDLLLRILAELMVVSRYLYEHPQMISSPQTTWDTPDVVRADILNDRTL